MPTKLTSRMLGKNDIQTNKYCLFENLHANDLNN